MSELKVFIVINGRDFCLAHGDIVVVIDIIREQTLLLQVWDSWLHQLVEDVVGALHFLLEGDPGLFQKIGFNITPSKLSFDVEMDSDEFPLNK